MLEVLHEVIDALAAIGAITGNRQAELHGQLEDAAAAPAEPPAPAKPKAAPKAPPQPVFESGNGSAGA